MTLTKEYYKFQSPGFEALLWGISLRRSLNHASLKSCLSLTVLVYQSMIICHVLFFVLTCKMIARVSFLQLSSRAISSL